MDGWDGLVMVRTKNHVFRRYLKNYSIFFSDSFCFPWKTFKNIFTEKLKKKNKFKKVKKFTSFFFSDLLRFFEKKIMFFKNYSIFFLDCFWSPQKTFKDIFAEKLKKKRKSKKSKKSLKKSSKLFDKFKINNFFLFFSKDVFKSLLRGTEII